MKRRDSELVRQRRSQWLRRALFQVHLWAGLTLALYVLVISLSGSAVVFRHEMDLALCPQIILVRASGPRMSDARLAAAARRAVPRGFLPPNISVAIRGPRVPGAAVEVWYVSRRGRFERLFDPYTGQDLGDAVACEPALVSRLVEFHDNLLGGEAGRAVNGVGALMVVVMCLTGAVIWWPRRSRWWHRITLHRHVHWRRFIWDLHSVLGFWMFALILLWAVSGVYFAFPNAIASVEDFLVARGAGSQGIDALIDGLVTLHFGRAYGSWVKVLWVCLGLVPAALTVTGALMWWNRVLRRAMGNSGTILEDSRIVR